MIEVLRKEHCVFVFDQFENRGIVFPRTVTTTFEDFMRNTKETAQTLKEGMFVKPLIYDFSRVGNYNALADFVCGMKNRDHVLDSDENAIEMYKFFFANSIPQISPGNIDFIYLGKRK